MKSNNPPLYTARPYLPGRRALLQDFEKLLDSHWFTNRGAEVIQFERAIADSLGRRPDEVTTCANATLGLELVLRALDLKGKVIVSPFTFVSTIQSILNAGLTPFLADIDPVTFCLAPEAVEKALHSNVGADVVAVVPVNVYGHLCDIPYFETLKQKNIRVIYDSAHAFGVEFRGEKVGGFGDAEVFSFHATKLLNACEGGGVVTRDAELAKRVRLMTNFGIINETEVEVHGTNAKLSEVHALFGRHSLTTLPEAIARRLEIIRQYRSELARTKGVRFAELQGNVTPNGQYCPILLESLETRDSLYSYLRERDIFSRRYFYPLVSELRPYRRLSRAPLPVAEQISRQILCLPLHASLETTQVHFITSEIKKFLKGR